MICDVVVSYDEKPGIQAIGLTSPDLPPVPGEHPTISRDYEYKRHGTMTLMAVIDLVSSEVLGSVVDGHRSKEFVDFLQMLDTLYLKEVNANPIPFRWKYGMESAVKRQLGQKEKV